MRKGICYQQLFTGLLDNFYSLVPIFVEFDEPINVFVNVADTANWTGNVLLATSRRLDSVEAILYPIKPEMLSSIQHWDMSNALILDVVQTVVGKHAAGSVEQTPSLH